LGLGGFFRFPIFPPALEYEGCMNENEYFTIWVGMQLVV
jgi:hypothetical protein